MIERPILFTDAMVRALLAGQKTQTRRLVKPQFGRPLDIGCRDGVWHIEGDAPTNYDGNVQMNDWHLDVRCPYGMPGDTLWVRECVANLALPGYAPVWVYRADGETADGVPLPPGVKWKPSIHMPRRASRLSLAVESVRVERVQDISDEDVAAEGMTAEAVRALWDAAPRQRRGEVLALHPIVAGASLAYLRWREAWTLINGRASYESNPWVWAITFRPVDRATRAQEARRG